MKTKHLLTAAILIAILSISAYIASVSASRLVVNLQPGPFAPDASGVVMFVVSNGVLLGKIETHQLPAIGAHAVYVLWFVRTDTGDKTFLGPLIHLDSILFQTPGEGKMRFTAGAYTDGPNAGSPIVLGSAGSNFFVVIAEDMIDTFMPFPVSAPPSSFALTATF